MTNSHTEEDIDWSAEIDVGESRYEYITGELRFLHEKFTQDTQNGGHSQRLSWTRFNQERWQRNWGLLRKGRWPRYEWVQAFPLPKDQNPRPSQIGL